MHRGLSFGLVYLQLQLITYISMCQLQEVATIHYFVFASRMMKWKVLSRTGEQPILVLALVYYI